MTPHPSRWRTRHQTLSSMRVPSTRLLVEMVNPLVKQLQDLGAFSDCHRCQRAVSSATWTIPQPVFVRTNIPGIPTLFVSKTGFLLVSAFLYFITSHLSPCTSLLCCFYTGQSSGQEELRINAHWFLDYLCIHY